MYFEDDKSNYTAGETISIFFSIKSICNKFIEIYFNEYSTKSNGHDTFLRRSRKIFRSWTKKIKSQP